MNDKSKPDHSKQKGKPRGREIMDDQNGNFLASDLIEEEFINLNDINPFKKLYVGETLEETFQKVERAKQEWESAVDSLPELICIIDFEGRIVRANRTAEYWGLGPIVTLKGKDFHELFHPNCKVHKCYLLSYLQRVLSSQFTKPTGGIEANDRFIGKYIQLKIHPVTAGHPTVLPTAVIVVQDITQRKQMEDALNYYTKRLEAMNRIGESLLTANSPQEIARVALGRMRNLVSFQRALLALLTEEEILVVDVFDEGADQFHQEMRLPREVLALNGKRGLNRYTVVRDLARIENSSYLEQHLLREGVRSYLSIPLIADEEPLGAFILGSEQPDGFGQDQIDIANEVADLMSIASQQAKILIDLNSANRGLTQSLKAREEMLQNVSHELRAPLQIIHGYASLMTDQVFGQLDVEQKEALDIILGRVDQLEFLVTRLLTLQSLENNEFDLALVDVKPMLQSLVEAWKLRAKTLNIQLHLDVPEELPEMVADLNLLTLAISNLLDNAVKYSPGGGTVAVQARQEEDQIQVSVSDEGIGIQPEKLDEIFERFVQIKNEGPNVLGSKGIGLALCHEIITAHGGRIWAKSEGLERGSKFTVSLPLKGPTGPDQGAKPGITDELRNHFMNGQEPDTDRLETEGES